MENLDSVREMIVILKKKKQVYSFMYSISENENFREYYRGLFVIVSIGLSVLEDVEKHYVQILDGETSATRASNKSIKKESR